MSQTTAVETNFTPGTKFLGSASNLGVAYSAKTNTPRIIGINVNKSQDTSSSNPGATIDVIKETPENINIITNAYGFQQAGQQPEKKNDFLSRVKSTNIRTERAILPSVLNVDKTEGSSPTVRFETQFQDSVISKEETTNKSASDFGNLLPVASNNRRSTMMHTATAHKVENAIKLLQSHHSQSTRSFLPTRRSTISVRHGSMKSAGGSGTKSSSGRKLTLKPSLETFSKAVKSNGDTARPGVELQKRLKIALGNTISKQITHMNLESQIELAMMEKLKSKAVQMEYEEVVE